MPQQIAWYQYIALVAGDEVNGADVLFAAIGFPNCADAVERSCQRDHRAGWQGHAKIAADGCRVAQLRGCAGEQSLCDRRKGAGKLRVMGKIGIAHQRADTHAAIGQMLIAQERPEAALDQLKSAIFRMPGDPVIQTDLALAFWQLGESRTAVAVLTTVLAKDGGNRVALRARGEILADLGEASQAMLDLDRVTLEARPSTRAARGLALAELGDRTSANVEVDEAVAEAPSNGAVLLHAARAKALNGDENAAEELAWRAVDATDPGLPPHHREVALQLAGHKHGK